MSTLSRLRRAFRSPEKINNEHPNPNTTAGKSKLDEQENGNGKPHSETKPQPVGFWHSDLRQVRNRAFAKWIATTAFLMAFILAVLSLYWGVFFNVEQRLQNLHVYVVDFDGVSPYDTTGHAPFVGPAVTKMVEEMAGNGMPTLGWKIRPASEFNNDTLQVRQAVYNLDAWAAIVINPNATAMLYSAVANGNTSYDPLGACQLVYQDARDDTNWYDFMLPILSQFMTQAQSMVGKEWAGMVLKNASDSAVLANIQKVPQAVNPAIGFSEFNLRPFFPYTGIPAVSIGLICEFPLAFPCRSRPRFYRWEKNG